MRPFQASVGGRAKEISVLSSQLRRMGNVPQCSLEMFVVFAVIAPRPPQGS